MDSLRLAPIENHTHVPLWPHFWHRPLPAAWGRRREPCRFFGLRFEARGYARKIASNKQITTIPERTAAPAQRRLTNVKRLFCLSSTNIPGIKVLPCRGPYQVATSPWSNLQTRQGFFPGSYLRLPNGDALWMGSRLQKRQTSGLRTWSSHGRLHGLKSVKGGVTDDVRSGPRKRKSWQPLESLAGPAGPFTRTAPTEAPNLRLFRPKRPCGPFDAERKTAEITTTVKPSSCTAVGLKSPKQAPPDSSCFSTAPGRSWFQMRKLLASPIRDRNWIFSKVSARFGVQRLRSPHPTNRIWSLTVQDFVLKRGPPAGDSLMGPQPLSFFFPGIAIGQAMQSLLAG